jgi:hypothetical protein
VPGTKFHDAVKKHRKTCRRERRLLAESGFGKHAHGVGNMPIWSQSMGLHLSFLAVALTFSLASAAPWTYASLPRPLICVVRVHSGRKLTCACCGAARARSLTDPGVVSRRALSLGGNQFTTIAGTTWLARLT